MLVILNHYHVAYFSNISVYPLITVCDLVLFKQRQLGPKNIVLLPFDLESNFPFIFDSNYLQAYESSRTRFSEKTTFMP